MQPFELVIAIMIADLASVPISGSGISLFDGIVPILTLLLLQLIISNLNLKSINARKIICGVPSILVYRGKIDEKVMRKEKFSINELQERLRQNNIFSIADVEYAILETSGQVTVIQKPEKRNAIPEDFGIMPEYEGISYDLIIDGIVMTENLKALGKDMKWLDTEIKKFKLNINEVLVATYDGKGQIFCQGKDEETR